MHKRQSQRKETTEIYEPWFDYIFPRSVFPIARARPSLFRTCLVFSYQTKNDYNECKRYFLMAWPSWKNLAMMINLKKTNTSESYNRVFHIRYLVLVCLLSLELFILGVQANKLHFCNLELILNKNGYSHIMENKKIFFSFFNMGTSWKKFDPPCFSQFSLRNPPEFFIKKIRNSWGLQFGVFWWSNRCWGSTLPKVMGKIQKAQAKIS